MKHPCELFSYSYSCSILFSFCFLFLVLLLYDNHSLSASLGYRILGFYEIKVILGWECTTVHDDAIKGMHLVAFLGNRKLQRTEFRFYLLVCRK